VVICLERGADCLHRVICCYCHPHLLPDLNPDWFYLLVPPYPGFPGKEAVKGCGWGWVVISEHTEKICSLFSQLGVVT